MRVSVVVPAWSDEREELLERCLASLEGQTVPPDETIVVVDHNPGLLERVARRRPGVAVIANTGRRGAAAARNTGTAHATGDVVAFLDDDACAAPTWLERLCAAYDGDGVVGVGGALEPLWPDRRPWWLPAEFDWVVGCTYRGLPKQLAPVRNLIGANMSFRRAALLAVGGERTGFGRIGLHPVACEETEVCLRVRRAHPGAELLFEPEARATHHVTPERTRFAYFLRRCVAEGRGKADVARLVGAGDGLSAEWRYTARTLTSGIALELRRAVAEADPRPLARAGAIVAGLAAASAGFAARRLRPGAQDAGP